MKRLAPAFMVGVACGALTFGSAALAEEIHFVELRPAQVPTTAQAFDDHDCGDFGTDDPSKDHWVFQHNKTNEKFVAINARFGTPEGEVFIQIPNDGGQILVADERATLRTEPGWLLVGAKALVSATEPDDGVVPEFFLDCAVPATATPPSTAEPTADPSSPPEPTSTPSSAPGPTSAPSEPPPPQQPELPLTGSAMLPAVLAGAGAVLGGATLFVTARRKRARVEA